MKKSIFPIIIAFLCFSTACAQKIVKIKSDLNTYAQVLDGIVNTGQTDKVNITNFSQNTSQVVSPENSEGIEDITEFRQQSDDAIHSGNKASDRKLPYKTGNPANWPADQDAVVSAPNNHKILLENENVRVLEVTLSPNELEPVHHHQWPSVLYIMEAGDFIDRDGAGNIILDTRQLSTPLEFPMTMWKDPEAPHSVENLSPTKPIRLIRVEMKK